MENNKIKEEKETLLDFLKTQGELVTIELDIRDLYRFPKTDQEAIKYDKIIKNKCDEVKRQLEENDN